MPYREWKNLLVLVLSGLMVLMATVSAWAAVVTLSCTESVTTGQPISCAATATPDASETLAYLWSTDKGAITAGQGTAQATVSSPTVGNASVSVQVTGTITPVTPVDYGFVYGSGTSAHGGWGNPSLIFFTKNLNKLPGGTWIKSIRYTAANRNPFQFAMGSSSDINNVELRWLSPSITPGVVGENTWTPSSPVQIENLTTMYLGFFHPGAGAAPTIAYRSLANGSRVKDPASMTIGSTAVYGVNSWTPSMAAATITALDVPPSVFTRTAGVTVTPPPGPTATATGPTTAYVGDTKHYAVTHDAGVPVTITWSANGTTYTGAEVDIPFPTAGNQTVAVSVAPNAYPTSIGTGSIAVAVTVPATPVVSLDGPATAFTGDTKQYSATHDATLPATISWDVNGTTFAGSPIDVPFATAGSYTVTATVTLTGYPTISRTSTKSVAVSTPAPTIALSGSVTANESDTKPYSVSHDATVPVTIEWMLNGSLIDGATGLATDISFATPGNQSVSVKVYPTAYPDSSRTSSLNVAVAGVPVPVLTLDGPGSVVEGETKHYTVSHDATLPTTITWDVDGTAFSGAEIDVPFTVIGNHNMAVTVVPTGYPTKTKTATKAITVTQYPSPTITMTGPATALEGETKHYSVTHDSAEAVTINWDVDGTAFSGAEVDIPFATTGSYNVAVTVYPTAYPTKTKTATKVVTVSLPPTPIVSIDGSATAITGESKHYSTTHDATLPASIVWDVNGTTFSGAEIDVPFATAGSYNVTATVTLTGYPTVSRAATKLVSVSPPVPTASITGAAMAFEGETKHYSVTHNNELDPMTITWDVGGTAYSGAEIDVPFATAGSINVVATVFPTAYPGSSRTASMNVVVSVVPKPGVTLTGPASSIEGRTERYSITHDAIDPVTITWDVNGAAFSGTEIDVPFATAGSYTVAVTVYPTDKPDRVTTKTRVVTVASYSAPSITMDGTRSTVVGRTERFTVTHDNTIDPMTVTWAANGQAYTGTAVDIPFPVIGTHDVVVTVAPTAYPASLKKGTITVIVTAPPAPTITMSGPRTTVEGKTETFSVTHNNTLDAMTVEWTINGETSQGNSVNVLFPTEGTYAIAVSVFPTAYPTSARAGTITVVAISVKPPLASITPVRSGQVSVPINLNATAKSQQDGVAVVSKWELPGGIMVDGLTATYTPVTGDIGTLVFKFHAYPEGYPTKEVVLEAKVPITSYEFPVFTLKKYHQPTGIAPSPVTFTVNAKLLGYSDTLTYTWDMGNGATVPNKNKVYYTYIQPGTFPVSVTVSDSKGNTQVLTDTVTVTGSAPITISAISVRGTNAYMKPPVVGIFKPTVTGGNPKADRFVTYAWTVDGQPVGFNSNRMAHLFTAAGSYEIGLTVKSKNGLTGSGLVTVVINPNQAPECEIDYKDVPLMKHTRLIPICTDADGKIRSFFWNLGNGQAINAKNVTARYTESGTYTVTLVATDNSGGQAIVTRDIEVTR